MSNWIIEDDGVLQFDQVVRQKGSSILLMAEIRRSPVEGTVVCPISTTRFYTFNRWLALGFLNHQ